MNNTIKITLAIEVGINIITNFALNALCAWLLNKNATIIAMTTVNIFIDTCITCLFICLCTTPFAAAAAKRYRKSGIMSTWKPKIKLLKHYPENLVLLALSFAFSVMLPLGIFLGVGFYVLGISGLSAFTFVLYKGVLGGGIGGLICALTLIRCQLF